MTIKRRLNKLEGNNKPEGITPLGVIITFPDGRLFETGLQKFVTKDEISEFQSKGLFTTTVYIPDNGRRDFT